MEKLRVLIIEDSQDILEDLPLVLETYGIVATPLGNHSEASRILAGGEFDCVLLDIKMPPSDNMSDDETDNGRLTGVLVCRALREMNRDIPIVAVTSLSDPRSHETIKAAGANSILMKPCYVDQIVSVIRELIGKGK